MTTRYTTSLDVSVRNRLERLESELHSCLKRGAIPPGKLLHEWASGQELFNAEKTEEYLDQQGSAKLLRLISGEFKSLGQNRLIPVLGFNSENKFVVYVLLRSS